MTTSDRAKPIIKFLLDGRYMEAAACLQETAASLPKALVAELSAHIEFHTGKLRDTAPMRWFEHTLSKLILDSSIGALLVDAVFNAVALILTVCGLRPGIGRRLKMRWIGPIIHYRYTNFARGLWQCRCLYYLLPRQEAALRSFLLGQCGHFYGMGGRFDRSIRILEKSRQQLAVASKAAPDDPRLYQYFCEILATEALHKAYAGFHDAAKASFDTLFKNLEHQTYWWIDIFARSMRLHVAMETVDETLLRDDALRLKRVLGTAFSSKYALRTTAYSALIAAIKGSRSLALSQLLESERFYDGTRVPIERSRYHFIRALAELELGEYALAANDSRIAVANLSFVPGARFHTAEAEVLDIEVCLRLYLAPGRVNDTLDLTTIESRLRAVASLVRGAPAIAEKVAGLRLLLRLAQGRILEASTLLPQISARLDVYATRLGLVVLRATGCGSGESLHRSPQLDALKDEFELTDLMIKVLAPERSEQDMARLVGAVFGASSCQLTTHPRSNKLISPIGRFDVDAADPQRLLIRLPAGRQEITFAVTDPLRSLDFDERVRRNLELASAIIQSIHLNEALAVSEKAAGVGMATQMLAHDVRKPFSLLRMTMTQMRKARNLTACHATLARGEAAVERALEQAETMIQDVMDLGSGSTARLKNICLQQLIVEALTEIPELTTTDAPTVACEFSHRSSALLDKARIMRVLHNLLQNAVQATGARGRIWIKTREAATTLEVTIGNTGPGIAPEHRCRIFDAFFTQGKSGGTGLGLTIAKQIVEDHGGAIWCTSSAESGTEFRWTVPKSAGAVAKDAAVKSSSKSQRSLHAKSVVVLDDDPFILDAWKQSLGDCDVLVYQDPQPFLQSVSAGDIHARDLACIITDYHFANNVLDNDLEKLAALAVPMILSSDALAPRNLPVFHSVIDKVALDSAALTRTLSTADSPTF